MDNAKPIPLEHNLQLLETIDENPQVTQADLAAQLDVAVGTVNWYIKRLITKGYIKIRRMQRKRLLYLITPRGIAEKSRLGVEYMRVSLHVYRETRSRVQDLLNQARRAGYDHVAIEGNGDLAEICRLTCLEQQVSVTKSLRADTLPTLWIDGASVTLVLPETSP